MSRVEKSFSAWTVTCQILLDEFATLLRPYFAEHTKSEPKTDFVLGQLSTSCLLTSNSAIFLITDARLWDAEMLVRSVLEGTYKFAFMCVRNEAERKLRVQEYAEDLPEINRLKRHARVEDFLSDIKGSVVEELRPMQEFILTEEELITLRNKYPRKLRQALEQKWAFTSLAQSLTQSDLPGAKALSGMIYTYSMSSHLVHQDADAVGMILERESRSPERIEMIELSHGARELSDLAYMGMYRVLAAYYLKDFNMKPVLSVLDRYSTFFDELNAVHQKWHDLEYQSEMRDRCE